MSSPAVSPVRTRETSKPRDRATLVMSVHHQRPGSPIQSFTAAAYRSLHHGQQCYDRTVPLGPTWQALDVGWVKEAPGLVRLELLLPRKQRYASPEVAAAEEAVRLEVTFDFNDTNETHLEQYLGWPLLFTPKNHSRVGLRCPQGPYDCRIVILPS